MHQKQPEAIMGSRLVMSCALVGIVCFSTGCGITPAVSKGMPAGRGADGPWWMRQTALTRDGQLDLTSKPWWPRARQLELGEQFVIDAGAELADRMLVRRERFKIRSGKQIEGIVWVIDDDADGSIRKGGDRDSDCYVVDYGCDGTVDRMVDYIDDDNDHDPDEMDIRYFTGGRLNHCWFGMDLDDDDAMWSLAGYEYGGPSFFEADPYGDNMIYMNKFNPDKGAWYPISECPFAFYDTDGDGTSEVVVRVSAVPLDYDRDLHPDYANSQYRMRWNSDMERMGIVNIRYSFDVDNLSSKDRPLHYDFGFNLVGPTPYACDRMDHFNAKRRPPQVTCVIPHGALRSFSDHYRAEETGFTWHEQYDDTIAIGYGDQKDLDYRWEGVFWIWERRFMENTGGPNQRWNVRREFSRRPSNRRELYFSEVDRRIHLFGAEEGWIQVGHFNGLDALGEIRMFDTDGNGYFDRWEVCLGENSVPVRVTTVRDERVRALPPFDYEQISRYYTQEVLPEAMAANARVTAAMREVRAYKVPAELKAACQTGPPNCRRYAQDIARELRYQDLRQHFTGRAHEVIRDAGLNDLRKMNESQRETTANTHSAWRLIRVLQQLDVAYGQGADGQVCELLRELARVAEPLP